MRQPRINLLSEDRRQDVLDVGPFLTGSVAVGPPPVPTPAELARLSLHPDDDLAPQPSRRRSTSPWTGTRGPRTGCAPTRAVGPSRPSRRWGEALDRLDRAGWHVLHSIPLPGGDRVHHLVIGPGGLFAVHTLYAHKQRVTVADPMVALGRREPRPLLRRVRADADLLRPDGRGPSGPRTGRPRGRVRHRPAARGPSARRPRTRRPRRTGGVLKPADVEALHSLARDRHTWASGG
ncbi:NERD domain-containing protein OS=Streptomyces alboniger OX=132473 GN=CP975_24310 PE=4 SV=1 [Streptomyces alboniger]